ncbi:DUF5667 domain-containing protein [Amorphoplanes digitatis]|uniref:DUF5667 domain-containing protein n=1 Tax=Actinoplanes digitatis TaxID=1868 RepID=A0A7W7HSG0_9ACTN|nr:DUF5667 domain-containing protein [Actinoplanes digitatis]MBB4759701.1 hypothetical protein [Actinoplanes digitatis]BFE67613.1 DUF5667 domain-containing protein [Actinoplanes digitatis]GID96791.1 hypothetical protein Adi01nite_62030 [Actinoplanes digitatis]
MNFNIFDRRSAERFAELLDETNGGIRHHTRGQADEQLAELVAIGHSLSAARSGVQVDLEFRTGLRAMLVATAERDGIGATATAQERAEWQKDAQPARKLFGRRIRARGAIVIGVAAGAMAVSGISAASENAAPGDALYGVKRSTERAQLAMAGSDVTRGQLSLTFARNRLSEAASMEGDDPSFGDVLDDMDNDTRQGVKLLNSAAVTRRDKAPLDSVDTFVGSQSRVLTARLDRLDANNQARALQSLSLLDAVHDRAADLRAGLRCDTVTQSGSDAIGPKLRECATGAATTTAPGYQQGHGQKEATTGGDKGKKAKPRTSGSPTADPATGGTPGSRNYVDPSADPSDLPDARNSDAPSDAPAEEDKGLLGGLLGGIFGS